MLPTKTSIIAVTFLLIGIATSAMAAGKLQYDKSGSKTPIQNLQGISPDPTKSRCDRVAAKTKGVLKSYSSAGYRGFAYSVTDDAGAALPVKRRPGNKAAGLIKSADTITVNDDNNPVVFDAISSNTPGKNYNICIERQ
ncbi:hypothetical protein KI809_15740 [Geobacter pelophilus]|uniref:Uncharacterized protein n=1 Tax=Geoanaerobacter pelophilus TaxID=60036 RepID=A0AAW4L6F9_9BACT|nr:hypothetical protein [Geoanaerobacter pelophilus]MBT0665762.1 hypothetical protein [Geoanaerobacter pelophilus]